MHPWPDLRETLRGIPWAVVGGVATRAYMPERMTNDLDVLVAETDAARALEQLKRAGYVAESVLAIGGHVLRSPQGVEVDLLLGREAWVSAALQRPAHDPAGYPVLTLPYLALMKLASARTQDTADLSRMLGLATEEQLNDIRAIVARYSPQDNEDLESLIYLGKQETQPPAAE